MIEEVADRLQALTTIGTVGTDIFSGHMPSTPIVCVTVYAQAGMAIPGDPIVHPGLQVLVRGGTYSESHTNAEKVFNALQNKWNILSTVKGRFVPNHEVGPNYRDGNSNLIFTLNFGFTGVRGT